MTQARRPSSLQGAPPRRRVERSVSTREAWDWAGSHRGRRPIAPPPSAGRAASKVLKPLSDRFGPGASELQNHWPDIVGDALAAYSSPVKFQSGAGGLTLVVQARGPASALIEAQSAQILERVARFSGRMAKRLKLTQGAITKRQPKREAPPARVRKVKSFSTEPEGLDAVMAAFSAAVSQTNTTPDRRKTKKTQE